jgi:hypothetical protein
MASAADARQPAMIKRVTSGGGRVVGCQNRPGRSFAKAIAALQAGDVLMVRGSTGWRDPPATC